MISDEAVEAAAKAHFENGWGDSRQWEDAEVEAQSEARADMRAALEAAAPHTLAEAWDEGSIAGWVESGRPHSWNAENSLRTSNPYRTAK